MFRRKNVFDWIFITHSLVNSILNFETNLSSILCLAKFVLILLYPEVFSRKNLLKYFIHKREPLSSTNLFSSLIVFVVF